MTANQIAYQRMLEEGRANRAREEETHRANTSTEALRNAELHESVRSNVARETEEHRSNVAREIETNRSNLAKEFENSRHNRSTESLSFATLAESSRANRASESIRQYANDIQYAHNVATETEQRRANVANEVTSRWKTRYEANQAANRLQSELETRKYVSDTSTVGGLVSTISGNLLRGLSYLIK